MPAPYTAPLADINFTLSRLVSIPRLAALVGFDSVTQDVVTSILEEAGKIAQEQFAPLNDVGDKKGAVFADGKVTTAPGFRAAYKALVDGGWNGLAAHPELGGQGLPWVIALAVQEMMQAANISLALCPLLTQGAVELLSANSNLMIRKILPKLVSGEWSATMNLTEPQAGSDVGAVKCKAVNNGDHYLITGQKIFISYGEHDLTENIIHLILARSVGAPEGTRGLSLFLVPKILVNEDGSLGAPNDVRAVSIEHKLGQHGSPTCTMAFGDKGGAIGYLVGQELGGLAAMFVMMNNARIGVGIQGLGLMERSYQHALEYARNRIQGRPVENPKSTSSVAIINHPDVRRMLMSMKSNIEAARSLAYMCGYYVDVAKNAKYPTQKNQAAARVDLLTPIVKGWLTDLANEITSTGVQVFGGMGYIEETGAAQFMRDARVLAIYEGTNGIQANDLVFRKLARDEGAAFNDLVNEIETWMRELPISADHTSTILRQQLSTAVAVMKKTGGWLITQAGPSPAAAAAAAVPFLRLCGNTLGGYYLVKAALAAQSELTTNKGNAEFLSAKIATARFYATHVLPQCVGLSVIIQEGAKSTISLTEAMF